MLVTSKPTGAKVTYRGEVLGLTPLFASVPRECFDQELTIEFKNDKKSIELDSKYRWKDSFFSNFVFLSFASIGWIVDLANCSAFEYTAPGVLVFDSDVIEKIQPTPVEKVVVVIAPPRGLSENLARLVGSKMEDSVRQNFPEALVIDYDASWRRYKSEGVDSFTKSEDPGRNSVYQAFLANRVLESTVNVKNGIVSVDYQLKDVFTGLIVRNWKEDWAVPSIQGFEESKVVDQLRKNIFWVPNTIGFDFSGTNVAVSVNEVDYDAEAVHDEDFLGNLMAFFGAINLKYLDPPSYSSKWHWEFLWVPSASANWGRVKFEQAPGLIGLPITTRGFILGYGPEIQYKSKYGQAYISIIPGIGYQYLSYKDNKSHSFDDFYAGWIIELGYLYFMNPNWSVRLFSRSSTSDDELWTELMKSRNLGHQIDGTTNVYSGISVGYSFSLSRLFNK
ncbi:MAG: hypothetical protein KDD61_16300 [Bdellovibrionales bacterium]|nr:hypothetical protein [Bdellovibrionales bacterium]